MIDAGENITLVATFTDSNGDLANPSTPVQVTIRKPDGERETFTAAQSSTGVYQYTYAVGEAGRYRYKFSSGDGAIEQDEFTATEDKTV